MIKLLVALALIVTGASSAALAQSVQECAGTNTSVSSSTPLIVINVCNVTAGPNGIILAIATGTTTCAVDQTAQMFVGTGSSPVVATAIPIPFGVIGITVPFTHNGCSTGASITTVVGALDATTFGGGVGTAYWIGVAINSTAGGAVTWNSNRVQVFTY